MRFQDQPLPTGRAALNEAVLLGRVLVGLGTDLAEQRVVASAMMVDAGLPDRDVHVRVTFRRGGSVVREVRFTVDANGRGMHHDGAADSSGRPVTEFVADLDDEVVVDRFVRLYHYLQGQRHEADDVARLTGRPIPPYALELGEQVERLAGAIHHREADEPDPLLVALVDQVEAEGHLRPERIDPGTAGALRNDTDRLRSDGALDSWSAAALLTVTCLPRIIAAAAAPDARLVQFARYFVFGMLELRISPWQALSGLAHKSVREGNAQALYDTARQLLDDAERRRDEAVDGPPDPDQFSAVLFGAQPYALTATLLTSFLIDGGNTVAAPLRSAAVDLNTTAEEVLVRLQDGVVYQWLDVDGAVFHHDREAIRAARSRGDQTAVQLLIRDMEMALKRPRSARALLLEPAGV